jgi:hypothetical protein
MTIARTSTSEHRIRAKRPTNGQDTQPSEHPRKGGHDRRRRVWVSSQQRVHKCHGGSAITRPRCASPWRNPTASTRIQRPLLELEAHAPAPEQGSRVVRPRAGHGHGGSEGGPRGGGGGRSHVRRGLGLGWGWQAGLGGSGPFRGRMSGILGHRGGLGAGEGRLGHRDRDVLRSGGRFGRGLEGQVWEAWGRFFC